jgi:chromosome segregation ATPase
MWGAKKYDTLIIEQIKVILKSFDLTSFIDHSVRQNKTKMKLKERNIKNFEKEYQNLSKQLDRLLSEIANSLGGQSPFTPDQLSNAIEALNRKIKENKTNAQSLKKEIEKEKEKDSDIHYLVNEIEKWEEKFDHADDDLKKAMLSRIIERVYLGKDEITIEFNLMFEESFIGSSESRASN